jgi:hypothetical protein
MPTPSNPIYLRYDVSTSLRGDGNEALVSTIQSTEWILDPVFCPSPAVGRVVGVYGATTTCTLRFRLNNTLSTNGAPSGTIIFEVVLPTATFPTAFTESFGPFDLPNPALLKLTQQGIGSRVEIPALQLSPAPPPPTGSRVDEIELLAHDTLLITFSGNMVNDAALKSAASYAITPVGNGIPVKILEVMTGTSLSTAQVVLTFTPPSLGEVYLVSTASGLKNINGIVMDASFLSKEFEDRLTKMDSVIKNMPSMYAMSSDTILRQVFQAVTRSDERIGGNRKDTLI